MNIDQLKEIREVSHRVLDDKFKDSNTTWDKFFHLIITLTTTLLFGTTAFFNNIFPDVKDISNFIIFAWVGLFLTLVFGIGQQINTGIFRETSAVSSALFLREIDKAIKSGDVSFFAKANDQKYYQKNSIFWPTGTIIFFLLSTIFLLVAFIDFVVGCPYLSWIILASGILLIGLMVWHFLSKYKKY